LEAQVDLLSRRTTSVPGIIFAAVLGFNVGYSGMKLIGIPVPQDTARPASPITGLQFMAGNYGAAHGILKPDIPAQ
jgi:hypothetical protein